MWGWQSDKGDGDRSATQGDKFLVRNQLRQVAFSYIRRQPGYILAVYVEITLLCQRSDISLVGPKSNISTVLTQ